MQIARGAWRLATLLAALVAALAGPAAHAQIAPPPDLSGLWGASHVFAPAIAGPVTVVREGSRYRAVAAGFEARSETLRGDLTFTFAGARGTLRMPPPSARDGHAMWIQPETVTQGVAYASPVDLHATGRGTWRGAIEPLADRIELYLQVERAADGTLTGFLRDPLANAGALVRITTIEPTPGGARVNLQRGAPIDATFDAARATLALQIDRYPVPLRFTRRTPLDAAGYFPRTPAVQHTTYRVPLATGDGWAVAPADAAGIDGSALNAIVDGIATAGPAALRAPYVHSISVARHGKLVLDEYFAGFGESSLHDTRSAGKTYADALVGAARVAGARLDERTPLLSVFRYAAYAHDDPRKRRITLGDALSYTTGLDCDDFADGSPGGEDAMQEQTAQPDWYKFQLDLPMVRDPGTKALYCSGSTNLAGGAVAAATGRWLPQFFDEHIARPLDMRHYAVNLTPAGEMYLGGGAYVRPRDFLKLGQLFLNGGMWRGARVIGADWIAASWRKHLPLSVTEDDGLAWHIRTYAVGGKRVVAYEAQGNGGQILDVLPQLDLAVMLTQGNYNDYRTWGTTRDDLVTRVAAAVRS